MNRKIVLLPLVLSALVLAGCGETGESSTASSEETTTSSSSTAEETSSSSEETPASSSEEEETSSSESESASWITLDEVIALSDDATFTARAYYVGRNSQAYSKGEMTYNAVYVADGATPYMIYNASQATIDALNLVAGESIVEFSGTVSNYNDLYECRLSSIKVIDDATGLEAPVYQTIGKDNADVDLTTVPLSTKYIISDAVAKTVSDNSNGNRTITFTVGEGTNEYTLYLDSRYNDLTPTDDLKVGDTFKTETFLNVSGSNRQFTYIANFEITESGEGGSTEEPEPEVLPTPVDTTIAEALTGGLSTTTLYKVTGVIEAMKNDDYGNAMLVDPATGDYITVYGNTTTMSAFTVTDGEVSYTNPKDAKTTLADVHDGDEITVLCLYTYYEYTKTHELLCVTTEHAAYDGTVAISTPAELANGTVTASKTEAAWGEEITITVTPNENYAVSSVKVSHGYASETLTEAPYTFTARSINDVTVELYDTTVQLSSYTLTSEGLSLGTYAAGTATIDGISYSYIELGDYGQGIQWRQKNGNNAALWNTTAYSSPIQSVTITWWPGASNSTSTWLAVTFGTEVVTVDVDDQDVTFDSSAATVTINCDVEGATFFRINHSTSKTGSFYIQQVDINVAA